MVSEAMCRKHIQGLHGKGLINYKHIRSANQTENKPGAMTRKIRCLDRSGLSRGKEVRSIVPPLIIRYKDCKTLHPVSESKESPIWISMIYVRTP